MKKIKVGIVGYGNLGKALEELLYFDKRFKLVKIFSRRKINAKYVEIDNYNNLERYKNKIDIMFLASGSSTNLMDDAQRCLTNFCTIDAFDTHKKIKEHIENCNAIAKQNHKLAFCSFGWDPGLFSLMRVLIKAVEGEQITCWGKGVSQGHSEALRAIPEVVDAVQYTVPFAHKINMLKSGKTESKTDLHYRECYINTNANKREVENKIRAMPNYFKNEKIVFHFVDKTAVERRKKLYHSGEVFCLGNEINFKIKTKSNPSLTAKIMIAFSTYLYEMFLTNKFGAFSILDLSFKELLKNSEKLI